MIIVERVSKSFQSGGRTVEALKDVSLKMGPGEWCGLTGPNGAGKTTLLRILSTHLWPNSGRAWVAGHDVVRHPVQVKKNIGVLPPDPPGFYARLTASQNLQFFGRLYGVSWATLQKRVQELSVLLGVSGILQTPVQELSSGTVQKFAVIRALVTDAPVLLFDELLQSLDERTVARLWEFMETKLSAKTLLMISHDKRELESHCDRVFLIENGCLNDL